MDSCLNATCMIRRATCFVLIRWSVSLTTRVINGTTSEADPFTMQSCWQVYEYERCMVLLLLSTNQIMVERLLVFKIEEFFQVTVVPFWCLLFVHFSKQVFQVHYLSQTPYYPVAAKH